MIPFIAYADWFINIWHFIGLFSVFSGIFFISFTIGGGFSSWDSTNSAKDIILFMILSPLLLALIFTVLVFAIGGGIHLINI